VKHHHEIGQEAATRGSGKRVCPKPSLAGFNRHRRFLRIISKGREDARWASMGLWPWPLAMFATCRFHLQAWQGRSKVAAWPVCRFLGTRMYLSWNLLQNTQTVRRDLQIILVVVLCLSISAGTHQIKISIYSKEFIIFVRPRSA
jgi:hypothetical protein